MLCATPLIPLTIGLVGRSPVVTPRKATKGKTSWNSCEAAAVTAIWPASPVPEAGQRPSAGGASLISSARGLSPDIAFPKLTTGTVSEGPIHLNSLSAPTCACPSPRQCSTSANTYSLSKTNYKLPKAQVTFQKLWWFQACCATHDTVPCWMEVGAKPALPSPSWRGSPGSPPLQRKPPHPGRTAKWDAKRERQAFSRGWSSSRPFYTEHPTQTRIPCGLHSARRGGRAGCARRTPCRSSVTKKDTTRVVCRYVGIHVALGMPRDKRGFRGEESCDTWVSVSTLNSHRHNHPLKLPSALSLCAGAG